MADKWESVDVFQSGNGDDAAVLALADQWNAALNHLVKLTGSHLPHCPMSAIKCTGHLVCGHLDGLSLDEMRTLLELALVRLAEAKGETNV